MDQKKVGGFIQLCRKTKNLTQCELAEIIGISNKTLSKWENGINMPDISIIPILCQTLDISVNELISGEKLNEGSFEIRAEENLITLLEENEKNRFIFYKQIFVGMILFALGLCLLLINPLRHLSINDYFDFTVWLEFIILSNSFAFFCKSKSIKHFIKNLMTTVIPVGVLLFLILSINAVLSANVEDVWIGLAYSGMPIIYALVTYIIAFIILQNMNYSNLQQ